MQMKCGFGKDRVACQQRLGYLIRDAERPIVILIPTIGERHQEARVSDCFHLRENPFRVDRSAGPAMTPASLRNDRDSDFLALSNWSRMILPFGTPVLRDVSANHFASSSGIRTVTVLLICLYCNTSGVG